MSKSTRAAGRGKPAKPAKPYPDFPLFPHATKRGGPRPVGADEAVLQACLTLCGAPAAREGFWK